MAQQNSFDIVSKVEMAEVKNALDQTMKEVRQRFDFKGSRAEVRLEGEEELILSAEDETKLRNMNDILQQKLKVQAAIQGDTVRVTGRDRDILQDVIAQLKSKDFGINMQYTNYRTN